MNIVVVGIGHTGSWMSKQISKIDSNKVGVYDIDLNKCKEIENAVILRSLDEILEFNPDILINAVTLNKTREVFDEILPFLPEKCILADVASVKNGLSDYYAKVRRPFVSTHPMFGPTFANVEDLRDENAIIIKESSDKGKEFFIRLYKEMNLNVFGYSFEEHDRTIAYSLGTPFTATMVFSACMEKQIAPGTTFKKHMEIAEGLLKEDDYLLTEIMFNPEVLKQVEKINSKLSYLTHIIKGRDFDEMKKFINKLRENIGVIEE